MTPENKTLWVGKAGETGPVVMVGDGANDAVALAAATVGIAVHGERSKSAGGPRLPRSPRADARVELIRAARRTMRAIHLSFIVSSCYNLIGASLAAAGLIGPRTAAILMPLS